MDGRPPWAEEGDLPDEEGDLPDEFPWIESDDGEGFGGDLPPWLDDGDLPDMPDFPEGFPEELPGLPEGFPGLPEGEELPFIPIDWFDDLPSGPDGNEGEGNKAKT